MRESFHDESTRKAVSGSPTLAESSLCISVSSQTRSSRRSLCRVISRHCRPRRWDECKGCPVGRFRLLRFASTCHHCSGSGQAPWARDHEGPIHLLCHVSTRFRRSRRGRPANAYPTQPCSCGGGKTNRRNTNRRSRPGRRRLLVRRTAQGGHTAIGRAWPRWRGVPRPGRLSRRPLGAARRGCPSDRLPPCPRCLSRDPCSCRSLRSMLPMHFWIRRSSVRRQRRSAGDGLLAESRLCRSPGELA